MRTLTESNSSLLRCLPPLLDSLGWKGNDTFLSDALPYSYDDFTLDHFIGTMANLKFKPQKLKLRVSEITNNLLPCLYLDSNDVPYVLIEKFQNQFLAYSGTDAKFVQLSEIDKEAQLISFSLQISNVPALMEQKKNWFLKLISRFKFLLFQSILLSFLLSIFSLISPLFVMTIYGQITIANATHNFRFIFIGILLFIIAYVGFKFFRSLILNFISIRMGHIVGIEVTRRILYLHPSYTEGTSLGSQLSRIRDFDSVKDFFSGIGMNALLDIPFVFILIFAIFLIGGNTALVPLGSVVIFIFLGIFFFPMTKKINADNSYFSKDKHDFILETFTNLEGIQHANLVQTQIDRFQSLNAKSLAGSMESAKLTQFINIVANSIISISAFLTIGLGVLNVLDGNLSPGGLMAIVLILWKILNPLKTFFSFVSQLDKIKSSIIQIDRFMNLPLEQKLEDSMVLDKTLQGVITFKQVSLRYAQSAHPSLLGIDFSINPNDILLILGHDGSGKSSILKLLLGMQQSQVGRIMIDNINIKQINPIKLRKQLAYCPERSHFQNDTIRNNFLISNASIADDKIFEVLDELKIGDVIRSFPEQLDTIISDASEVFSPTLLKQLSLARTFLKDTNILIFDEASKNLDNDAINSFVEYTKKIHHQKTVIISTHDPQLLHLANKILWLDNGRIKMFGSSNQVAQKYVDSLIETGKK